mmetsp:Transcript_18588/g.21630  ORF Transcript_18588/g.21630 Transcript_18588/m.21630 type:complete len:91 (+) Transcript_18588:78-350(+)
MPGYENGSEPGRGAGTELLELGGMAKVQAALLKSDTFACCHSSFLEELLLECELKKLPAGTNLWEKGGKCDEIFILSAGQNDAGERPSWL